MSRPRRKSTVKQRSLMPAALVILVLTGGALLGGCEEPPAARARKATADRAWAWLTAAKRTLDARRDELARLEAQPPGEKGAAAERLRAQVESFSDLFDRRLVAFINADPPALGAPLSPRQLAAIRMKTDEDMVAARRFIAVAGDHRSALEILQGDLVTDPDNPRLRQEIARVEAERFMRRDRFAQIAKGMGPNEVRRLLGQPNPHNVRSYPDKGVLAWFYPKDESGAACGVWFDARAANPTVYSFDWNAIPGRLAGAPAAAAPAHASAPSSTKP